MSDITKCILTIIGCYFLVIINQNIVATYPIQKNGTNSSKQFQDIGKDSINQTSTENLTTLDYYFFSYDVIDHKTLLIKFDLTRTILFQQTSILFDAYLYVSKIPSINYRINIGPFSGFCAELIDGTITDHFTFCLVLIPNRTQTNPNITLKNNTESIYYDFLISSYQEQQQYILHYCTKIGPDEDRHRYPIKQGSKGDRVLLLLQIILIGIFLVILQSVHFARNRKVREWRRQFNKFQHELLSRKERVSLPTNVLAMLQFARINNEELQNDEQEDEEVEEDDEKKEDFSSLSYQQLLSPYMIHQRSQSRSPNTDSTNSNIGTASVEHILENKPWIQIPH